MIVFDVLAAHSLEASSFGVKSCPPLMSDDVLEYSGPFVLPPKKCVCFFGNGTKKHTHTFFGGQNKRTRIFENIIRHKRRACCKLRSKLRSNLRSKNQIIRTSDTRNLRPCTLSTNLYIVNPEPELKPKDYARIR
jgi:hypothetical protein